MRASSCDLRFDSRASAEVRETLEVRGEDFDELGGPEYRVFWVALAVLLGRPLNAGSAASAAGRPGARKMGRDEEDLPMLAAPELRRDPRWPGLSGVMVVDSRSPALCRDPDIRGDPPPDRLALGNDDGDDDITVFGLPAALSPTRKGGTDDPLLLSHTLCGVGHAQSSTEQRNLASSRPPQRCSIVEIV